MITRRLRDRWANGEPITIENFIIDTISAFTYWLVTSSHFTVLVEVFYAFPSDMELVFEETLFTFQTNDQLSLRPS